MTSKGAAPPLLDQLTVLADPTRSRLLVLLERHELTVSELCRIMQVPQSTASRHLKALTDSGWVTSRAEGTSRQYTMARGERDGATRRLWQLVREQVATTSGAAHDRRRLQAALAERRTKSRAFFASSAAQWDKLREELFGGTSHLTALAAFLDPHWVVGDLGCGTGRLAEVLAPFVARVVGIDESAAMLQAARKRLQAFTNVDLRRGELEALPLDDERLDAAAAMLVLHHLAEPEKAVAEAARSLKRNGRLVVVDMLPHDREGYAQQMGHVWLGFTEEHTRSMLVEAGFGEVRIAPLPPDPSARGPALFVATGTKT